VNSIFIFQNYIYNFYSNFLTVVPLLQFQMNMQQYNNTRPGDIFLSTTLFDITMPGVNMTSISLQPRQQNVMNAFFISVACLLYITSKKAS